MTRRYDAVIFDLDGTLIDSAEAITLIAGRFLAEHNIPPITIEETRGFVGNGGDVFARRMLRARGLEAEGAEGDAHVTRFFEFYAAAPGEENPPYSGAEDMLDALVGLALGMCTNKPYEPTLNVLDALGWRQRFGSVVAGDTLAVKKPDPEPLLHTMRELGVPHQRVLFVGDSEVDTQTALAAGVDYALHTNGYRKTPAEELPALLRFDDFSALSDFVLGTADGSGRS